MDLAKLKAPFPVEEIQWRVGATNKDKTKGLALAYYDARALYDRLDEVCGPANWQIKYSHANGKTCADIGILILFSNGQTEWVWKANGAGDTEAEAEKGAFSDAAKRAGVPWGIGRYLYEMKNVWVEIESFGKSHKIKESEQPKLVKAYQQFIRTGEKPNMPLREDKASEKSPAAEWAESQAKLFKTFTLPTQFTDWSRREDVVNLRKQLNDTQNNWLDKKYGESLRLLLTPEETT